MRFLASHLVILLCAASGLTAMSCHKPADAGPAAADELVGTYTVHDTMILIWNGDTATRSYRTSTGYISKIAGDRIGMSGVILNGCLDSITATVTPAAILPVSPPCFPGMTIARSGTTIRYWFDDHVPGTNAGRYVRGVAVRR